MARKNNRKSGRLALLGVLGLLLFGSIGISLAYWASSVNTGNIDNGEKIDVGGGETVNTTIEVSKRSSGGTLVPPNYVKEGEVDVVSIYFDVSWHSLNQLAEGAEGKLIPSFVEAFTSEDNSEEEKNQIFSLIEVKFDQLDYSIVADGKAESVRADVSLKVPNNKEEYDLIANRSIFLSFLFKVDINE